jgi:hypothetical protein
MFYLKCLIGIVMSALEVSMLFLKYLEIILWVFYELLTAYYGPALYTVCK